MPRQNQITGRGAAYGELSTQSFSEYLATLGLFLTLCISGMLTFVSVRLIGAYFPGTPQPAYWLLGIGIFVAAYFAYGQIKLAPLLTPILFVVVFLLCREVALQPRAVHSHARTIHQAR
jgi:hypothetical protein